MWSPCLARSSVAPGGLCHPCGIDAILVSFLLSSHCVPRDSATSAPATTSGRDVQRLMLLSAPTMDARVGPPRRLTTQRDVSRALPAALPPRLRPSSCLAVSIRDLCVPRQLPAKPPRHLGFLSHFLTCPESPCKADATATTSLLLLFSPFQ